MDPARIFAALAVMAFLHPIPVAEGAPRAPAEESQLPRSVSSSGQFLVYGDDMASRGAFCVFAEGVREGLMNVLNLDDAWVYPVVIQIRTQVPASTPERFVRGQIMPIQKGYRFQLDVLLADGFTREAMNEELTRILILERMLRSNFDLASRPANARLLPHWLHYGVLELVRYDQEGTPNELFASVLASNKVLRVEEILEGDPTGMNSISRAVFEASAAAFLKTLLGIDSGPQRVAAAIHGLPEHEGSQRELLFHYFPSLAATGTSLEKWWALEMAALSQPKALDFLDAEETQARLEEALTVRFRLPAEGGGAGEPVVCRLSDYDNFIKLTKEGRAKVLAGNELELLRLTQEALPVYRSIIDDYREIVKRLVDAKKWGLSKRFEDLEERTARLAVRMRDVEDFMNWYEATQLSRKSGVFSDYKKAVDELRREAPRRDDGISGYLDGIEAEKGRVTKLAE